MLYSQILPTRLTGPLFQCLLQLFNSREFLRLLEILLPFNLKFRLFHLFLLRYSWPKHFHIEALRRFHIFHFSILTKNGFKIWSFIVFLNFLGNLWQNHRLQPIIMYRLLMIQLFRNTFMLWELSIPWFRYFYRWSFYLELFQLLFQLL